MPALPGQPSVRQTVTVVDDGKVIGRISIGVPLDAALLAAIDSGLGPAERLVAVRDGRIVAGVGTGAPLHLTAGVPTRVSVAGRSYRAVCTSELGGSDGVTLVALSPQSAIDAAADLAERRVIDVSGDGADNEGGNAAAARDRALARGISINGLPILYGSTYLYDYYHDQVIGGPGAFVEPAVDMRSFRDAMLRKLVREISAPVA